MMQYDNKPKFYIAVIFHKGIGAISLHAIYSILYNIYMK